MICTKCNQAGELKVFNTFQYYYCGQCKEEIKLETKADREWLRDYELEMSLVDNKPYNPARALREVVSAYLVEQLRIEAAGDPSPDYLGLLEFLEKPV